MKKFGLCLSILFSLLLISFGYVFAEETVMYFSPDSGNIKMYCDYDINVNVRGSKDLNAFGSTILFEPSDVIVTGKSINSWFQGPKTFEPNFNGNSALYHFGASQNNPSMMQSGNLGTIKIKSVRSGVLETTIYFADKNGEIGNLGVSDRDGLFFGGVSPFKVTEYSVSDGATYNFYAYPCDIDGTAPTINKSSVDGTRVSGQEPLKFSTYDYLKNAKVSKWFNGATYSYTGVGYVSVPNNLYVDNQEGVDPDSITVTVSCPNCEGSEWTQHNGTLTYSGGNGLILDAFTDNFLKDNNTVSYLTWDSQPRGYDVTLDGPTYEVEKQVIVKASVRDLQNENGESHPKNNFEVAKFNTPVNPTIAFSGNNGLNNTWISDGVFPSKSNKFRIKLYDEWAGINTGSVTIKFEKIAGSGTWNTYTLSGTDFTGGMFQIYKGLAGTGNSGSYYLDFYPAVNFLESSTVKITVTVRDLAGNTGTNNKTFVIRGQCSEYGGCRDYLNIRRWNGADYAITLFSGLDIVVSGGSTDSIYPFLEGEILYCGEAWEGADLVPQGVMNLYQYGNASVQTGLRLSTPNKTVREAANSADVNHDFGRDENNRNMIKDISVY